MQRDELSRLREEFERLYKQPDILNRLDISEYSVGDRPGWLSTLQTLWQQCRTFLTEESGDSHPDHLTWWQMHRLRMGAYVPSCSEKDSDQAKDWLERLYRD